MKSRLIGKDPDAGKDRRQEEKEMTEDEMVEWHHRLNGHEFEQSLGDGEGQGQAPADGEGQGSLARCSPCGCNELDTTEQLNKKIINSGINNILNFSFHKQFQGRRHCVQQHSDVGLQVGIFMILLAHPQVH